ncbi:hypothetical protein [Cellulomonas chengniuliangii]|uniref:BREX-3 system P-loop-containing protein BrxF n=1 Tax=Cellulomonas chengniuliangii TaxID=2968084 RepID=A0ABY5KXM5_9CELL|nr:hypothetical protein [Cellulomonas chengniuliangii]MCC2309162.1 hypothetical protein [Cellulomonas chengniuliangii]UUI75256.1 hypothetical protein NP064_16075 [Cellulomonas chengniuliangii]
MSLQLDAVWVRRTISTVDQNSVGGDLRMWPQAGVDLWRELERAPGRVAFVVGDSREEVAETLAELRGAKPFHVGLDLTALSAPPAETTVRERLSGHPVLNGIEVLFDDVLNLDPVRLFRVLATTAPPVAVVWPGTASRSGLHYPTDVRPGGHTAYSVPGAIVIRTCPTVFADDVPFTLERLP